MAIYEYKCKNGHLIEEKHPMDNIPKQITCPECGYVALKQFSSGVKFKGLPTPKKMRFKGTDFQDGRSPKPVAGGYV